MRECIVISDGDKIKTIREKYNLKQDEISGNDITRNLISEIETNKANITKKTAEVIIKNLTELAKKKGFKVTETVEYLMENQIEQANKVLGDYIEELKTLVISKDGSFIETLKKAEGFLIDWDIKDKKLKIYELAGDYFCNNNEMYKSAVYYEKASALLSRMFLDKELLTLSRKLSMVYGYMGNYEKSIEYCEFALSHFKDMPLKDKIIFRHNNALNYKHINNYERALYNIEIEEKIFDKTDTSRYIKILNNKASCLYEMNKKQEALKLFDQVLNLTGLTNKNDIEKYLIVLTNIIHVCIEINLKNEAIENLDIVVNQLVNLNKDSLYMPSIYFEVGKIYKELDKLDLSEEYYLKALDFAEKQKNYVLANEILSNLIEMYLMENKIEKVEIIKEKVFCIANKQDKVDDALMYKLIIFCSKISSEAGIEIANFALKFKK